MIFDQLEAVVQRRQHAQAEQVELDQADGRAVVLVPLQDGAVRHPAPLDRADLDDRPVADHHAAGVDAQVPGRVLQLGAEFEHLVGDRRRALHIGAPVVALLDLLAPGVLLARGVAQRLGDVADGRLGPVADDVRDLGGVVAPVALVDVLDRLFATVGLDVDVDVRRFGAFGGEEPLEHQLVADGVDRGDADGVTDRRVGRRAPALGQDAALLAELHDVPDDQEIAGKTELLDDVELVVDDLVRMFVGGPRPVPVAGTVVAELAQEAHLVMPGRHRERGQRGRDEVQVEGQLIAQRGSRRNHAGPAGEPLGQLVAVAQMGVGPGRQPAVDLVQAAAGPDGSERGGQRPAGRCVVVGARCRDHSQARFVGQAHQGVIAFVGEGVTRIRQLDDDVVASEPVDQLSQRAAGRIEGERAVAARLEGVAHRAFAAAGEHQPVVAGKFGQLVQVVDGPALAAAAPLAGADPAAQAGVPAR